MLGVQEIMQPESDGSRNPSNDPIDVVRGDVGWMFSAEA